VTDEIMLELAEHIRKWTPELMKDKHQLLILDGHSSRHTSKFIFSFEGTKIHVYQLIGNGTGWFQVHDVGVYAATQQANDKHMTRWKKANPGRMPTHSDMANIIW
jgi:hypothetical protein